MKIKSAIKAGTHCPDACMSPQLEVLTTYLRSSPPPAR
jgi:hypothetical protein